MGKIKANSDDSQMKTSESPTEKCCEEVSVGKKDANQGIKRQKASESPTKKHCG